MPLFILVTGLSNTLKRNSSNQEALLWLTASYSHLGHIDNASWQLENIRSNDPTISIGNIESVIPLRDPVQLKHLLDGLYKAGLK